MNKRKVGELYGTPIVTGNKNYANGHEYYLTMNEDNTYRKLEQRISDDKFRTVLGGGGDYTTPNADDEGKVMQVVKKKTGENVTETVYVPKQTCNMEDQGKQTICTLQNVDESFGPGFSGIVILDGIEYDKEWSEEYSGGFSINGNCGINYVGNKNEYYLTDIDKGLTHTIKVITRETEPVYGYSWEPNVKLPIPTAEDEGKILVVTETEDTSIVVPEQSAPVARGAHLTNVDLTKFVVGNTVKVTVTYESVGGGKKGAESANSQTFTATGIIADDNGACVDFDFNGDNLSIWQEDNLLYTNANDVFGLNSTIKLEYLESNYEYQLQENSGSGNSSKSETIIRGIPLTQEEINLINTQQGLTVSFAIKVPIPSESVTFLEMVTNEGITRFPIYEILHDDNNNIVGIFAWNLEQDQTCNFYAAGDHGNYDTLALSSDFLYFIMS